LKPNGGGCFIGVGMRTANKLTRIYGTAWETPEQLQNYLGLLEEAEARSPDYR